MLDRFFSVAAVYLSSIVLATDDDRRSGRSAVTNRRYSMEAGCPHPARHWLICVALLTALIFAPSLSALDSEPAPLASHSLLLDVARAGQRLVAVGDRGHVLFTDDEGRNWRQVIVPTRAMLTGISFGDARHGWAVGHDGVILATSDGGLTWTHQDSGQDLETIYLDVYFSDAQHGLVVGAYGKCLLTLDGGKTWQPAAPITDEVHLNQIAPLRANSVLLAGESGTLLASDDARAAWRKLKIPYEGSLFGALYLNEHALLAYGLRGHVFASNDGGETWIGQEMPVPVLIMTALRMKTGLIVMAGTGGNFFLSSDLGQTFANWKPADYKGGVSALLETTDGALLVVGELGVSRLAAP